MKHKLFVSALLGTSLILIGLTSCASGPKPAAPTTEEPGVQAETTQPTSEISDPSKMPPDPVTESSLAEALARAEKSRKQAFDLDAPAAFAEDWKKAEDFFLAGREKAQVKTQLSYSEAIKAYTNAADAYDELARKALPIYAEARRKELEKARADAVKAGAERLLPAQLAAADKVADTAQNQFESGDYYTAIATAQEARTRYIILKTGLDALSVQQEIDRRDFAQYDASNYSLAEQKLQASQQAYDAGDVSTAQNNAEEALLRYRLVLNKGREMYASGRSKSALAERQAAQDLKANVAVKSDFERAQVVFTDAEQAFKAEKYDEAADLYAQAEALFAEVKTVAAEKRAKALETMQAAQQKITATEDAAKKADTVLEGGSR
jgi:hypothetical protein